ncbi:unnamed protein product [Amoebophrya sp. A25]|nr:unnamed protein product [Amoebophrya sp. A25]|eukprot:GSA25T00012177001.1
MPCFARMPLQFLLDEIDEGMANTPASVYSGRSPNQTFWGLEEATVETTHPDDFAAAGLVHNTEYNIGHLTECRLRIQGEIMRMQLEDQDYRKGVDKIIANCRAQIRENDTDERDVGQEVEYHNLKSGQCTRGVILAKHLKQGTQAFEYTVRTHGRTLHAVPPTSLSTGINFDHFNDIPLDLQPLVPSDFQVGGRAHNAHKRWLEANDSSDDVELRAPAKASSHEAGPFFSYSAPGEGTAARRRTAAKSSKKLPVHEADDGDSSSSLEMTGDEKEQDGVEVEEDEEEKEPQPPPLEDLDLAENQEQEDDLLQSGLVQIGAVGELLEDQKEFAGDSVFVQIQQEDESRDGQNDLDSEEETTPALEERWQSEFVLPTRADRRALTKILAKEKTGSLPESSVAFGTLTSVLMRKREIRFTPESIEMYSGWSDERKPLSKPEFQDETLVSWGVRKVQFVKNQEEFTDHGGQFLIRFVMWNLDPEKSYEELNLMSIFDPRAKARPEVTERLLGALKHADTDHSFADSPEGLDNKKLLLRGHLKEWTQMLEEGLVQRFVPGVKHSDERVLTARAICDLKMKTPRHFTVAIRVVPGGHNSSVSASAESPTMSEVECRLVLNSVRHVRGKKVIKSGDVPRAFLQNHKLKPENRPRFKYPHNVHQEYVNKEVKSRLGVGPGDILIMLISLYGLREAALLWYRVLSQFLMELGYKLSVGSPCVFFKENERVGVHVGDLLYTGNQESFEKFAAAMKSRFNLKDWNDARDGLCFTGQNIVHRVNGVEESTWCHMKPKIEEMKCARDDLRAAPEPGKDGHREPLSAAEVTALKEKRGSLLFISRSHPEARFPTRCLAVGADVQKDLRWTVEQDNITRRLEQESPGVEMDLSYKDEYLCMAPERCILSTTHE